MLVLAFAHVQLVLVPSLENFQSFLPDPVSILHHFTILHGYDNAPLFIAIHTINLNRFYYNNTHIGNCFTGLRHKVYWLQQHLGTCGSGINGVVKKFNCMYISVYMYNFVLRI